MRFLKKAGLLAGVLATVLTLSAKADAAVLTIMDGTDTWTLTVTPTCSTCSVTLAVTYGAASARAGQFLDAIQWDINGSNLGNVTPTSTTLASTVNAGLTTNWTLSANNLNNNGCGPGGGGDLCAEWNAGGAGFGPIVSGSTHSWTFSAVFPAALTFVSGGNIRAAYNNANGQNAGIFSPNGGNFGTSTAGTAGVGNVPEPTSLLLVGAGLAVAARRLRRQA